MQASRKKTRKFLLQKLYARIYGEVPEAPFQASFFQWILDFDVDVQYLDEMYNLVVLKQDEIICIIKRFAPKFDIDTMLKTNILAIWIALTEMLWYSQEIPAKVSMNEAIDLAKYYWDPGSKNIVNGILNTAYENIADFNQNDFKSEEKFNFFSDK